VALPEQYFGSVGWVM